MLPVAVVRDTCILSTVCMTHNGSGAPVIAIASTIPSGEFGTEYFQETNTIKLFNDCSYYNEVATTPQAISAYAPVGHSDSYHPQRSSRGRLTRRIWQRHRLFLSIRQSELFHPAGSLSVGRGPYTVGRFIEQS